MTVSRRTTRRFLRGRVPGYESPKQFYPTTPRKPYLPPKCLWEYHNKPHTHELAMAAFAPPKTSGVLVGRELATKRRVVDHSPDPARGPKVPHITDCRDDTDETPLSPAVLDGSGEDELALRPPSPPLALAPVPAYNTAYIRVVPQFGIEDPRTPAQPSVYFFSGSAPRFEMQVAYLSNFTWTPEPFVVELDGRPCTFRSIELAIGGLKAYCSGLPVTHFQVGGRFGDLKGSDQKACSTLKAWEANGFPLLNKTVYHHNFPTFLGQCVEARARVDPEFVRTAKYFVKRGFALRHFERSKVYHTVPDGHHCTNPDGDLLGYLVHLVGAGLLPRVPAPGSVTVSSRKPGPEARVGALGGGGVFSPPTLYAPPASHSGSQAPPVSTTTDGLPSLPRKRVLPSRPVLWPA